ncbi:MAG: glycosyl transferase, partial [Alphaproteobacteria bacterium HGW-Alphaproteobacteria-6]
DGDRRRRLVDAVLAHVAANELAGLCLDPRGLTGDDLADLPALLAGIGRGLADAGRQSCVIAPAEGALWRDAAALGTVDLVVLLGFVEPWEESPPAALAPQPWFEAVVAEAVARIGADRLVVAMGSFGHGWTGSRPEAEPVGYGEAMHRMLGDGGRIGLDPEALNSRIDLVPGPGAGEGEDESTGEGAGGRTIWLLDAVSLYNQRRTLARHGLAGMAVWPLGLEDPGVWPALAGASPADLGTVRLPDFVGYDGDGPFMHVDRLDAPGQRRLTPDPSDGLIRGQDYARIPAPVAIRRFGAGADDMVVLTFDDGPDATHTPGILDALAARAVPATFFLIGSNVMDTPATVRRMIAEGHEIGSHTFLHPDIEVISDLRRSLELNALQRLLISVTGHSTTIFRTPYGRGPGPLTAAEALAFVPIEAAGYTMVGSNAVPRDWEGLDPEAIVASTLDQMKPRGGNVIVMHDGGGDRSATVAALPLLIDTLRAQGYRFVTLASLLGVERAALMPAEAGARVRLDAVSFTLIGAAGTVLRGFFWIAITLGALRALTILTLALARRRRRGEGGGYLPPATVVIPAFNEEEVILTSVATAMNSDYPDLRVIVIDDGSRDHTYQRVAAAWADDPRVTILRQDNQGKALALDHAYGQVGTEIVVAIDADTLILPDAIRRLVQPFRDPAVGAVAGKVRVGNQTGLLTRLQALEYIVAQNIERRAAEVFHGILVVPGAIGAWRVAAVRKAGLYTNETQAEDADLTVAVQRAGYRVVYEPAAVSVTEAPATLGMFMRQRLRWTLGMMQTAWKHRRAAREGRAVGLIAIPDLWLFGVVLALLAPVADLVFFGVLADLLVDIALGRPMLDAPMSALILAGYLLLPLIDVVAALVAFGFERKAPWLVLLIPVQRLVYRPLLYITVYRAVWRALTGTLANWGRQVRLGTVRLPGGT